MFKLARKAVRRCSPFTVNLDGFCLKIVEFPINSPRHLSNVNVYFYSPDPVSYYNPLHIAVLRNRPNMVRLLAGHGADIEKRDRVRQLSLLCLVSSRGIPHAFLQILSMQYIHF